MPLTPTRKLRRQPRTLYATVESPIGELLVLGDGQSLFGLYMQEGPSGRAIESGWTRAEEPFVDVKLQLEEYFGRVRTSFDLSLAPRGS